MRGPAPITVWPLCSTVVAGVESQLTRRVETRQCPLFMRIGFDLNRGARQPGGGGRSQIVGVGAERGVGVAAEIPVGAWRFDTKRGLVVVVAVYTIW